MYSAAQIYMKNYANMDVFTDATLHPKEKLATPRNKSISDHLHFTIILLSGAPSVRFTLFYVMCVSLFSVMRPTRFTSHDSLNEGGS